MLRYLHGKRRQQREQTKGVGPPTNKNKTDEKANADFHAENVQNKMAKIICADAVVDPWTMTSNR